VKYLYNEDVKILIDGRVAVINVCCLPNMPEDKLKELAIGKYIREMKQKLYKENNCKYE
jgi:hypothetical protein